MIELNKIYNENNLDVLKRIEDNSISGVITDPPYGLGKQPDVYEMLKVWMNDEEYAPGKGGFMGRNWDSFLPGPRIWKECYRVLKPGARMLVFSGTRTYDLMVLSIRMAGFEVSDAFLHLYGSGFPKNMDISKAIDLAVGAKREIIGQHPHVEKYHLSGQRSKSDVFSQINKGAADGGRVLTAPATESAKIWNGYGTAYKPATELICIAQKPIEGTYANNAIKWGVCGFNVDAGRIATNGETIVAGHSAKTPTDGWDRPWRKNDELLEAWRSRKDKNAEISTTIGRWPANVIFSHHPDCECVGVKKTCGTAPPGKPSRGKQEKSLIRFKEKNSEFISYNDADGNETVPDWRCHPDCPVAELDRQSGVLISKFSKSKKAIKDGNIFQLGYNEKKRDICNQYVGDTGGASRFFYCAKASRSERNAGCEHLFWRRDKNVDFGYVLISKDEYDALPESDRAQGNVHPTVKPLKILEYLAKMHKPPGGDAIFIDPFCGSGSILKAFQNQNINFIGCDISPESCLIANCRLNAEPKNKQLELLEGIQPCKNS